MNQTLISLEKYSLAAFPESCWLRYSLRIRSPYIESRSPLAHSVC